MFIEKFYDCLKHDGIVAVATASKEGKAHVVNTWNKYIIVTDDEKLLIPCYGFRKTERNIGENPYVEITLGIRTSWATRVWGRGSSLSGRLNSCRQGRFSKKCTTSAILPIESWSLRRKNAPR